MARSRLFDSLLQREPIFRNKEVLQARYTPEELPHRQSQVAQLASILVPALRGETPSNVFIYGKTGTGKTAVAKYVGNEIERTGRELNKSVNYIYVNCEEVDTQYRVLTNIANHLSKSGGGRVPFTGWPTDEVMSRLKERIDARDGATIIILDEVDKLVKNAGGDVLYNLTRLNASLHNARVSMIGISNDLNFTDHLDSRVKSSLAQEEMVFHPYNSGQLEDILRQRAKVAFKDGILDDGVIQLCAALAAHEHGDARRALDLLRVSAEVAERDNAKRVNEGNVRLAQKKIEIDRVSEVVKTLPTQSKLVLLASLRMAQGQNLGFSVTNLLTTGEVYNAYSSLCRQVTMETLTQRRVTDLISELDSLGILNAKVISKGRYGRTKQIQVSVPIEETLAVLYEDETIAATAGTALVKQVPLA
ncbi:MAG: ORC1-type DNA replication protein [Euryarchaeota archaeon]|nr:ORC1-type DNA replication protein [Euryarchaeota archaeon]